jgi:hypothetical protein
MRKGEFAELQQIHGLHFEPLALVFDRSLRTIYRPIGCLFWDWLHVLIASGGVLQFAVNQVCLAIEAEGISLARLDELLATFVADNKPRFRLRCAGFFSTRIVRSSRALAHCKGFGSEVRWWAKLARALWVRGLWIRCHETIT